jgi:hypothetical protein
MTLETLGTQDAGPFNSVSERFLHIVHVDKHRNTMMTNMDPS